MSQLFYYTPANGDWNKALPIGNGKLGAMIFGEEHVHDKGITPACAGKRIHGSDRGRETWDHPRVCGEKGYRQ